MLALFDRFSRLFARPVDGLCDPRSWRRAALVLSLVYVVVWSAYGLVAKSSQDVNADMAEMIVWARQLALGYPKHPPFLAYVVKLWFSTFPLTGWAFTLLAVSTVAAGIYLAIEACSNWLDGEKRAAIPFLLATIPFYNFLGLKFDQNSALIPLWAFTILAFIRSLQTRAPLWASLTALAAAAAILTKYWSAFLLASLVLAALLDDRRRLYWRSSAPWITIGIFCGAVTPHVVWLVQHNFPPLTWIETRREAASVVDFLGSLAEYSVGTLGYSAVAVALAVLVFRPSPHAMRDGFFALVDKRRTATLLFWAPLILPVAVALVTRTNLLSLWNAPALNLLPVMALGSPLVVVSRLAAMRLAALVSGMTLIVVAASPVVAVVHLKRGVENDAAYPRLAAEAIERQWRETTYAPLLVLAGRFTLATAAGFYLPGKPVIFADFSNYLSPWANEPLIERHGLAIICAQEDTWCLDKMNQYLAANPAGRRDEVTLARHWLGLAGPAKRFVIAALPPQS